MQWLYSSLAKTCLLAVNPDMGCTLNRLIFLAWLAVLAGGCTPTIHQQKPVDGPPAYIHSDLSAVPDAVPRPETPCRWCTRPYEIAGIRYVPLASSQGYREQGNASWYGTAFHGKPTASGERYDMFAMTAAHKTLPLPSYVRVRNLQNGRQITVKVNDRGPFHTGRIIDLSYAAAVKLGIDKAGSAAVEVVALPATSATELNTPKSAPLQSTSAAYYQAGAFADQQNAVTLKSKLLAAGIKPVTIVIAQVNGRPLHRVRIGPIPNETETLTLARLRDLGLSGTKVVIR